MGFILQEEFTELGWMFENVENTGEQLKTVFITISGWFELRNLLRTDAFKILKAQKDVRVVVFTHPTAYDVFLPPESRGDNVIMEDLTVFELNTVEKVLRKMEELIFFNINRIETVKIYEMMRKRKEYSIYLVYELMKRVLGKNKNLIDALESADKFLSQHKYRRFRELFEKYRPSLVLSTDFLHSYDLGMIKAAKTYGVPVICMVANWDHLCKARLPKCGGVIVWNEFQKNQLIKYYNYSPERILVSGIPHQDYFVKEKAKFLQKEEFLKRIGAPAGKKLLTYTTMSKTASKDEPELVEIINGAMKNGVLENAHLHMRLHPGDNLDRYEKLKGELGKGITFEKAIGDNYLSEDDMLHYANLLYCSGVVVNIASSVTLDALAFDVPVVNISFDGYHQREFTESTARFFSFTHYAAVVKSGGVRVAKNADELINYIKMYLQEPSIDRDERRAIVREHCGELDGKSGERIAKFMLNFKTIDN